jgi:hypothetical protein
MKLWLNAFPIPWYYHYSDLDTWTQVRSTDATTAHLETDTVKYIVLGAIRHERDYDDAVTVVGWLENAVKAATCRPPWVHLYVNDCATRAKLVASLKTIYRTSPPFGAADPPPRMVLTCEPARKLKPVTTHELRTFTRERLLAYRRKMLSLADNPEETDYIDPIHQDGRASFFRWEYPWFYQQYDYDELTKNLNRSFIYFKIDPRWNALYAEVLEALKRQHSRD